MRPPADDAGRVAAEGMRLACAGGLGRMDGDAQAQRGDGPRGLRGDVRRRENPQGTRG